VEKGEKPIGYWLREADRAITEAVNRNLERHGLTRTHWQVLNTVRESDGEGGIARESILELLGNFLDGARLEEILGDFYAKKWMEPAVHPDTGAGVVRMTEEGRAAFSGIFAAQQETRMRLFEGVTREEYDTLIRVLRQVVQNASQMAG